MPLPQPINKLLFGKGHSSTPTNAAQDSSSAAESKARDERIAEYQQRLLKNQEDSKRVKTYLEDAKVSFLKKYESPQESMMTPDAFEQLRALGSGSFGRVFLLKEKGKEKFYALKIMSKKQISKSQHISHIMEEKRILYSINFPFLISLYGHYQDNSYVYLILEYVNGGEMFLHLRRRRKYTEAMARFYASQVVLAFEYLHYMDIIYRDLKPENILISQTGYIKIIDMGFAKRAKGIVWTLCGTPEYIAPEILMNRGYNKAVDWYAMGILLYEMVAGFSPFWAEQQMQIYEKILEGRLRFPSGFSTDLKDLVKRLLQKDLTYRYGNLKNGVEDIKDHRWFMETDWMAIFNREVAAPFCPKVKGPGDCDNFESQPEEPLQIADTNEFGDLFKNF